MDGKYGSEWVQDNTTAHDRKFIMVATVLKKKISREYTLLKGIHVSL